MLKWLLCLILGHKRMSKAFTGNTMLTEGITGERRVALYKWERNKYCPRCGKDLGVKDGVDQ